MLHLLMITFTCFLTASTQLLIKKGLHIIGHFEFCFSNLLPLSFSLLKNPYIVIGILLQPLCLATWVLVLSRVEVSYAGPMASLSYIFVALGSYFFLGESLSLLRIIGIVIIIGGVCLVARS